MEAVAEMREEVDKLIEKPISFIFLTHNHLDHAAGISGFSNDAVTVFCSHKCVDDVRNTMRGQAAVIGVRDKVDICLNGLKIELEALNENAHSPWDMLVRIPQERAVCTGDLVVAFEYLYFHMATPERWAAKLREYAKGADEIILPGHGDVFSRDVFTELADFITVLVDIANENMMREYPEGEALKADTESIERLTQEILSGGGAVAEIIKNKAKGDAQRVLFMVLRNLLWRRFY
jgi:glyoxylase-like metal-dependent hydrolase (beta-lactamase superfamily II)